MERKVFFILSLLLLSLDAFSAPEMPPLPAYKDTQRTFYVSSKNITQFQDFLLAPIAEWVKQGNFVIRAVRSAPFDWNFGEAWATNLQATLQADGSITAATTRGFPFGSALELDSELDSRIRAQKVLWSSEFVRSADLLYDIELSWLGVKSVDRRSSALYARVYGKEFFFEELFKFAAPALVSGYSIKGRRFMGAGEDALTIYSPISDRSRTVFQSNRSDGILGGLLTPDDFLGFSNKLEAIDAIVLESKTLLSPIAMGQMATVGTEAQASNLISNSLGFPVGKYFLPGLLRTSSASSSFATWNFETGTFPGAPAWLPSSLVFAPRPSWIVETATKDPFTNIAREILVIDKESFLPVYKISYDLKGRYIKTMVAAWGLASVDDGKRRFPFLAAMLVVDRGVAKAQSWTTKAVQLIENKSQQEAVASLMKIEKRPAQDGKAEGAQHDALEHEVDE